MNALTHFRVRGVAAVLATGMLASACGNNTTSPASNGTMAVQLTDAPFPTDSVKRVDVFVVRVDGRVAAADSSAAATGAADDSASMGGWTTLASPNESVNLLAYQNGAALPLGEASLAPGSYLGFRIVIDPTKSSVTLTNGTVLSGTSTPGITFPSASRSGIKIVLAQPVVITAKDTTTVLVDFMVGSSFVMRGNSLAQNGLLFTPVVQGSIKP